MAAWVAAGLEVEVVELDPAGSDAELEARWPGEGAEGRVLGGFSRGARIAVQLARRAPPLALLCFGYPFHRRGEPRVRPGLELLGSVEVPTLIVQGSRDAHGSRSERGGFGALPGVELYWLDDGNHRFVPRARTGRTQVELVGEAAAASLDFLARLGEADA